MTGSSTALPKADPATIEKLFSARAVAIVGATPDLTKLGSSAIVAMQNLGFKGKIYAVNPRYDSLMGHPCVASVADLPDEVEAAMLNVPAEPALLALEACALRGIRSVVLVAQGFGEAGEEGKLLDLKVIDLARRYGMAICGPNTNGLANPRTGLAMAIAPAYQYQGRVKPGPVGVVSQSGGMVSSILTRLAHHGVGISRTVTCGNELLLTAADYLGVMADDPGTEVIVLFLETIRDAATLRRALARCRAAGKPVVALKVGRSDSGQKAALSHTGAIAGSYRNTVAFLEREGAVVVDDIETLAAVTELLMRFSWPPRTPPKPCILAISGGFAALAADEMAGLGLALPEPSPSAAAELRGLPNQSLPVNPYDIAAQNAVIPAAADIFHRDGFNQLIFGLALLKPDIRVIVRKLVLDARAAGFEQVYVTSPEIDPDERAFFNAEGIAISDSTRPLFRAMGLLAGYRGPRVEPPVPTLTRKPVPLPARSGLLDEAASKAVIAALGIPSPRSCVLHHQEGPAGLTGLTRPLAMKGLSGQIEHKTEHGLVALDLRSDAEIEAALARIGTALAKADPSSDRILVEEMVRGGLEAIVGLQRDPVVGPVVVVGAGGILVELLDDAVVLMPPFTADEVSAALAKTRFDRLLTGYRGRRYDRAALIQAIVAIGDFALAEPRVESLDINPLFVLESGVVAADAKLFLG